MSTPPRHRHGAGDAGISLIEVIVTVAILGIGFVTIVGGMTVSIAGSDSHRKQATSQTVLRNLAEYLQGAPYEADCEYDLAAFTGEFTEPRVVPAGSSAPDPDALFEVSISAIAGGEYSGPPEGPIVVGFDGACEEGSSLQRLTLEVQSLVRTELTPETLDIVKRQG